MANQTIAILRRNQPQTLRDPDLYRANSAYAPEDWESQTTSIGSSIYRGLVENGRRYQTLRPEEYFIPSDDQQFESYEAGHLVALATHSGEMNPLFFSPIGDSPTVRYPAGVLTRLRHYPNYRQIIDYRIRKLRITI
ncbi:hypothetical protein N7524_003758 [Penicillium chrysogenum]|nr:hypothetical protein N7524_003758 [Penicillium chrysogenum]